MSFSVLLFSLTGCLSSLGCSLTVPTPHRVEFLQRVAFQTIQVNNHRVAYLDSGQGPPVILIHGFGGSMWQWEYQYSFLAQSYRVIVPDLLGSGLSDKPDIIYSPERLVLFFREFMKNLQIEQATLIGNSMGAGLAMAMALDYPNSVNKLILISGFPSHVEANVASSYYRQFLRNRPPLWLATLGNQLAGRGTTERLLKEIVFKEELISDLVIERSYQNRQRSSVLPSLYSLLDHLENWEQRYGPRLASITHPTLLLWGAHDRVFPKEVGTHLRDVLSQAEWEVIPESGHLPQWEEPEVVNPRIQSFLQKRF